jgi:hypothetical protein
LPTLGNVSIDICHMRGILETHRFLLMWRRPRQ